MRRVLWMAVTVAGLMAAVRAAAQTPVPTFSLAPGTLVLAPGETGRPFSVTVLASNLTPNESLKPELRDLSAAAVPGTHVKTTLTSTSDALATSQAWAFDLVVANFPAAATQTRTFVISYGNVHGTLSYTLTNVSGRTFTWSVKGPAEWNVAAMPAYEVGIKVGELPATGVGLTQVSFLGADLRKLTLGSQHFEICRSQSTQSCEGIGDVIAPGQTVTAFLRPVNLPVGLFKGIVGLTAREKTDAEVIALTIYSPRAYASLWGAGAFRIHRASRITVDLGRRQPAADAR